MNDPAPFGSAIRANQEHEERMRTDPAYARNYHQERAARAAERKEFFEKLPARATKAFLVCCAIGGPPFLGMYLWAAYEQATAPDYSCKNLEIDVQSAVPPVSVKLADGRTVALPQWRQRDCTTQAQAALESRPAPFSDTGVSDEFVAAGTHAPKLAGMYAQLLHLLDPSGEVYPTIESLRNFASDVTPKSNQVAAYCLVHQISAFQVDLGLTPITDSSHPLYAAGASTRAQEQSPTQQQTCGR
jgi:hypothetical protein